MKRPASLFTLYPTNRLYQKSSRFTVMGRRMEVSKYFTIDVCRLFPAFCRSTCSLDHRADALLSSRISIRAIKSSHNYEASDRCIVRGETLRGSLGAGQEAETKQRRETADSSKKKERACRALTHFSSFYIGEGTRRNATNATGYFHSEGSFLNARLMLSETLFLHSHYNARHHCCTPLSIIRRVFSNSRPSSRSISPTTLSTQIIPVIHSIDNTSHNILSMTAH
ncbi:unnamed protein product [Heterotrigona itama]|uniref:Uncharacterized protein n=1 Tax=Heterotrigona itama TaxID=395501 RepID=A0A6V7HGQ2_9HYME|nr:unnamed protein product [Heterotrigona itama]